MEINGFNIPVKIHELPAGWLFVLVSPQPGGDCVAVLKDGSFIHFTVDPRTGQAKIKDSDNG